MKAAVKIIKGDITKCAVDVIVNAANTSLLGGSGVDGAIHKAGGPAILAECREIRNRQGNCAVGQAVYTSAGHLPAKYVIHTVGPVWSGDKDEKALLLKQCYHETLLRAESLGTASIAFPNISTGIYHFPKTLAAELVKEVLATFAYQSLKEIMLVCFDEENYNIYTGLFEA